MKFFTSILVLAPLFGAVVAHLDERDESDFQVVDLTFNAGPVSYSLSILADGETHLTSDANAQSSFSSPFTDNLH
jgi:hypothetical protein